MQYYWGQRQTKASPLGLKVADILGQVYLGIYHIDREVLNPKVDWANPTRILITLPYELATHDGCDLTFLVLCCLASNVEVRLRGRFNHYCQLEFSNQTQLLSLKETYSKVATDWKDLKEVVVDDVINHYGLGSKKPLWR